MLAKKVTSIKRSNPQAEFPDDLKIPKTARIDRKYLRSFVLIYNDPRVYKQQRCGDRTSSRFDGYLDCYNIKVVFNEPVTKRKSILSQAEHSKENHDDSGKRKSVSFSSKITIIQTEDMDGVSSNCSDDDDDDVDECSKMSKVKSRKIEDKLKIKNMINDTPSPKNLVNKTKNKSSSKTGQKIKSPPKSKELFKFKITKPFRKNGRSKGKKHKYLQKKFGSRIFKSFVHLRRSFNSHNLSEVLSLPLETIVSNNLSAKMRKKLINDAMIKTMTKRVTVVLAPLKMVPSDSSEVQTKDKEIIKVDEAKPCSTNEAETLTSDLSESNEKIVAETITKDLVDSNEVETADLNDSDAVEMTDSHESNEEAIITDLVESSVVEMATAQLDDTSNLDAVSDFNESNKVAEVETITGNSDETKQMPEEEVITGNIVESREMPEGEMIKGDLEESNEITESEMSSGDLDGSGKENQVETNTSELNQTKDISIQNTSISEVKNIQTNRTVDSEHKTKENVKENQSIMEYSSAESTNPVPTIKINGETAKSVSNCNGVTTLQSYNNTKPSPKFPTSNSPSNIFDKITCNMFYNSNNDETATPSGQIRNAEKNNHIDLVDNISSLNVSFSMPTSSLSDDILGCDTSEIGSIHLNILNN